MYYLDTYRVGARDTDPFNCCRPSSVLNFLQEAATQAAAELGVSRDEIVAKYNCFWMLVRMWYRLDKPLRWNDELTVKTWHRGGKSAAMYRDFDLYCNGEPVGEAVSTWVLADLTTHKLKRLSEISEFHVTTGGDLCKSIMLHRNRMPEQMAQVEQRPLRYSDCDVNGHVNNVRYADYACDAIHMEQEGEGKFVSSFHISYLKECLPGETISLSVGRQEDAWCVRGSDENGADRFETTITLKNCP